MMNDYTYDYFDDSWYKYASLHRKLLHFDPMNTDNPLIMDYVNSYKMNRNNSPLFYTIINNEMSKNTHNIPDMPISFQMVLQSINIDWVDLIHQLIFIDNAYDTFFGEYCEILEKIILNDTPDIKETLIYRNFDSGTSIFHIAGKIWLLHKYKEYIERDENNITLDEDLKYIFNCYRRLEDCFGSDREYCLLYMMDFSGKTLKEYLELYAIELVTEGINYGKTKED